MTGDALLIPRFARLDEYFGLWSIYPPAAEALFRVAGSMDLDAHVQAAAMQRRSVDSPLELVEGRSGRSVAIIRAVGPLMKQQPSVSGTSTIALRRAVRQAAADDAISGILLAIDSPGGTVAGTNDLAADVRLAASRKPVVAHIDDLGASAAYWVASQATKIYANDPTALVGSIGTVLTVTDTTARDEREGVRRAVFATGPFKAVESGAVALNAEAESYLQGLVNDLQQSFDSAVMRGRSMSESQLAAVRTGAVFPASRAKELGLIDGIRPLERTIRSLMT